MRRRTDASLAAVLAAAVLCAWCCFGAVPRPSLTVPEVVPAVPDRPCVIHYRSVTDAVRPEAYGYLVDCKVGRNDGKSWTWTPGEDDAGRRVPLVLSLLSDAGVLAVATTCVEVAKLPADRTRPLTLAILGDSLTNCRYQDRLLERMRETGFTGYRPVGSRTGYSASPVGTFEPGQAAHDGYGGYSWRGFMNNYAFAMDEIDNIQSEAERRQLEKSGVKIDAGSEWRRNLLKSPLLKYENGRKVVDVQGWFDRINAGQAPDVILVELGGNDVFYRNEDGRDWEGRDVIAKVSKEMDLMLDALRAAAPTSLIALATAPTGGRESGFAANYGSFRTSFTFRSSILLYNRMLSEKVAARKDPRLVAVPVHHAVDSEKGYPVDNALHLTDEGGRMIGDALFAWLAGRFADVTDARPYEFVDARRETDEIAPWIDFETETGWRAEATAGGFAAAERCDERQLFGKKVLRLRYRGARDVRLRPARPIEIPAVHEWFAAWIWNDQSNYAEQKKPSADYGIVLVDAQGKETRMPFRRNGYDKVMGWMAWTWMAKRFSPDELKILEVPGLKFDGFYVSGVTNDEMRTAYFDNLAFFTRDESRPLELAKVPAVGVPTRPEGACPLSKKDGARTETGVADGVATFSYVGADGRLDYFWRGTPDTLEASWNGGARFRPCRGAGAKTKPEAASYEARLDGKTLVVDVRAPAGEEYVSMGRPDGARILSRSAVGCLADGYRWEDSRSLVTALDDGASRFFTLTFGDWYVSDASALTFHADAAGVTNCAAVYRPKTDGSRNPVRERLYVTVSPDFIETLPVIANPTSVWKKVTGSHAWCAYGSSADRGFDKAFWRNLHGLGVRKVVINDHECCMRDGGESFTFREKAAPGKGGDAGLRDWTDFLVNELHYRYGPYNNFTDFAPVNANWRFDRACRQPSEPFFSCGEVKHCSGGLTPAWMRNYGPKPQWAYEACRHYAPILEEKFGFNTAYCDVHTAVYPWIYCDFDARCEGAGKFRTVFNAYCAILEEQKRNWNGPVYSEGGCQFLYAGHVDGNYAQVRLDPDKDPWIVDFDLRRIHPLECDFGMGNLDMFTATPKDPKDPVLPEMLDRFLAATLAFGHAPYLCVDAMFSPRQHHGFGYALGSAKYDPVAGLPLVLRSYFMVRPAAERYSLATAEEILYLGADGTWRDVSAAVLSGDRKMNRIAVRYSDGTCVVANGDKELRLKAAAFGRELDLPPTGYVVWTVDGSLEIESSDRFGSRVDYSASPEAVFLDTRGAKEPVVFPRARGKGRAVRFRDGGGWKTVVLEGQVEFEDDKRTFGVPRPQDADYWWRALKSHEHVRCLLPDTIDLVLVGDSITAGWGGALAGRWFKRLRQDYSVHNLGVGSDRCEHILWRMENGELDGYRAKTVMILAGTNNLDEPVEDVVASVGRIVATVRDRQPQTKVILVSVFPRYESATHPFRAWVKKLNAGIRPLADGERVRWLDFGNRFLAADGTLPKALFPDGTHPNADGYAIWYEELSRVLAELIPEGGSARQTAFPAAKGETEIVRRIASVDGPARDYAADPAFVVKYRKAAVAIAKRKMAEVDEGVRTHPTVVPTGRRLATGGQFGGFFLWDSAFSVLWARYLDEKEFPVHSTLDNFYTLATPSGFIPREYTPEGNPCWTEAHPISFSAPILSWAEVELFRMGKSDKARLVRVYPFLKRHHEACRRSFRRDDGLYFGDQIGCGMDDLVRWPKDLKPGEKASGGIAFSKAALGAKVQDWWTWLEEKKDDLSWNRQAGWIDLSCEVAFDCLNLAELAEAIGRTDDAAAFRAEHASLARVINEKCWDESRGFYFDVTDGGIVDRYMGCAYWALISKVATPARAKRMVEKLFDPRFFGRSVMVPSLAACEPDYDPEKGYWRGACWPPTTYMTIQGLKSYGYVKEAEQVARRFYNANAELFVRTGTIWEDISAEQCHEPKARACRDFCGWSALAPIALPIEWNWTI